MDREKLLADILKELRGALLKQKADGSFDAGHNGPYADEETPVRNTAHFLFGYSAAFEKTGDQAFRECVEKAFQYLVTCDYRRNDGAYVCRKSAFKDDTNGVIGHAWIIEALLRAQFVVGAQALRLAEKLWELHRFDYDLGIWAKPRVSGKKDKFDHTFNHQLWFSAVVAQLKSTEADEQVKRFIRCNVSQLQTYGNGVIFHNTPVGALSVWLRKDFLMGLRKLLSPLKNPDRKANMYLHSAGYHTFNLYAFAMLFEAGYSKEIRDLLSIDSVLAPLKNESFKNDLRKYPEVGIRYNPSGIEAAYALEVLGDEKYKSAISDWLRFQIENTSCGKGLLVKSSPDTSTSAARIYQALRIVG